MKKRGILLVTALMVTVVLLLIGMGLLGSQSSRYEAAKQSSYISQARQLALAGLEDARMKLELDINFPPPPGPEQTAFSYSETLITTPYQGTYSVLVDMTYATDTASYIVINSVGTVGSPTEPTAQYRLRAELDNMTTPAVRPANVDGLVKDRFFRFTHIQDEEMP